MREAALMIAAARDDFAPSLLGRVLAGLAHLASSLDRRRRARRHLARLRTPDAHLLDDLGLMPGDIAHLDLAGDPSDTLRHLAAIVAHRRHGWRCEAEWSGS
jgi:uncharacterized protein YjiS (DUF1127 family)